MTIDQRLLQAVGSGELLAQRWIAACRNRPQAGTVDAAAAADFLRALAAAMARAKDRPAGSPPEVDASLIAAGRAFAWAAGSTSNAVEQLVALRAAFQAMLTFPSQAALMNAIHLLVDGVIVGVVRETVVDLERDALLDPLTGLFNRRALARNLDLEIGRARRLERPFSMVFLDVDHLKAVNDSQGHAAGDAILAAVADALRAALRQADSAYRVGGDEFVVLLPETLGDAIGAVVERLIGEGSPACTWGAASYPEDGSTATVLLRAADNRLLARRQNRRASSAPADVGCQP
jgi:diguanylate cyclase (GGDEF)-like protein